MRLFGQSAIFAAMNVAAATSSRDLEITVAPARPWDIVFLTSQVALGAAELHFAQVSASFRGKFRLALRCAKAILGTHAVAAVPVEFTIARIGTETVGAMLTNTGKDPDGSLALVLEYLVVDKNFQHLGIGKKLLRHLATKQADVLRCWCTVESRAMRQLLSAEAYKRTDDDVAISSTKKIILMPSQWEKRLRPRAKSYVNGPEQVVSSTPS